MAFKARFMGMFPDIGGLTSQMNDKFEELLGELKAMHGTLGDILAELRTQRGAPS
jgi:hypothetical protein